MGAVKAHILLYVQPRTLKEFEVEHRVIIKLSAPGKSTEVFAFLSYCYIVLYLATF